MGLKKKLSVREEIKH